MLNETKLVVAPLIFQKHALSNLVCVCSLKTKATWHLKFAKVYF